MTNFLTNDVISLALLATIATSALLICLKSYWKSKDKITAEEFAAYVMNNTDDQICVLDLKGYVIKSNRNWDNFTESISKYTHMSAQRTFQSLYKIIESIDSKGSRQIVEGFDSLVQDKTREFRSRYRVSFINETCHMEMQIKRISEDRLLVYQIDRTESWRVENRIRVAKREADAMAMQLEANQRSLELAIQGGRLGIWHWDIATGYFDLSDDWYRRIGHRELALEFSIDSYRSLLHEEDKILWSHERILSFVQTSSFDCEFRIRCPNGNYVWIQALGSVNSIREDGMPESLSGVLIDINDRKHAELKDLGMAHVIEDSLNEVYIIDKNTNLFLEVNRGARENLGYTIDELREMNPTKTTGGDKKELLEKIDLLVEGQTDRIEYETVHIRKDGSTYPFLLTLQLSEYDQREVFVAIGTDISKRNELEERLRQSQKLETIGQLAAGVAHEINTPLHCVGMNVHYLSETTGKILNTLDHVQKSLSSVETNEEAIDTNAKLINLLTLSETTFAFDEVSKAIEDSTEAINRVIKIVHAMKELSHPGNDEMEACDLNHLLESTIAVTQNRWKNHAVLNVELCPDLMALECDAGKMNQVFVNLLVNASDAIKSQQEDWNYELGVISIRTKNLANYVVVEVEDSGCGMDKETISRVFEPFFTTKQIGVGSGQGMALCQQIIVHQHHGNISVQSKPGKGTKVRIKIAAKIADRQDLNLLGKNIDTKQEPIFNS